MRYEIRPLGTWTGPATEDRPFCRFRADWTSTLDLLARETEHLGAELVVLQVDVRDGDIRRDGMLAARARVGFPGVRVSFTSIWGPQTYATDRYDDWRDNVRAIALSLEALRAVNRYGVSQSGEQYRGWTAIGNGQTAMTADEALLLLAEGANLSASVVRMDPQAAYRVAARRHHPDAGGSDDAFQRIAAARDILIGRR